MDSNVRTSCVQTDAIPFSEKSIQIPNKQNIQIQTDPIESTEYIFAEFNQDALLSFLRRVTPMVCQVLEKNIKSKAFDRQHLLLNAESISISRLHQLKKTMSADFCCSSISWNAVGTAIASSYTFSNHTSWCDHDSSVDIWSINRKDFDPKKPNIVLETDCCITFVSFHPELPAIIVVGKLNGEILLWDISKEDDTLLCSSETILSNHREPITGIHWIRSFGNTYKIHFSTCSLDGKILLWRYENGVLEPYKGFIILLNQLPQSFLIKNRKENAEVGITLMSINAEDGSIFVIGIEGGGLFQCSFDSLIPALDSGLSSFPLNNPITMSFERHKGQVTALQFSPFSRNMFLSAGSDGEIRLYSLLQPKPLMVFSLLSGGVNAVQWSLSRPLVFSCVCTGGRLHIWDLVANEKEAVESCPLHLENTSGLVLQGNKQDPGLLATSCLDGSLQIWKISGAALNANIDEDQQLQNLAKSIH